MNTLEASIESAQQADFTWMARRAFKCGYLLGVYQDKIKDFLSRWPDAELTVADEIKLFRASREAVLDFIKVFGGKWKKEVEAFYPDKIKYSQSFQSEFGFIYDIIITMAPPPPSCEIVEEEVEVPARREKRKKIVCKQEDDEIPIATEQPVEDVPV